MIPTPDIPRVRLARAGVFGLAALTVVLAAACTLAGRDEAASGNATSAATSVGAPAAPDASSPSPQRPRRSLSRPYRSRHLTRHPTPSAAMARRSSSTL